MSGAPEARRANRLLNAAAIVVPAAVVLALGGWIIDRYPVLYWWDAYHRLFYRDQLVVWRWLPALQTLLFGITRLTTDVEAIRMLLAVVAAAAAGAGGWCVARLFGGRAGLVAGLWIATNSAFVTLAFVPYQEALFALGLFVAFGSLAEVPAGLRGEGRSRWRWAAAAAVNVACLTRYEGWMLLGLVVAEAAGVRLARREFRAALWAGGLTFLQFGGIPVTLWLMLAPIDVNPHEAAFFDRLAPAALSESVLDFGRNLWRQLPPPVLVLAALGLWWGLGKGPSRAARLRLLALIGLDVAMTLVVDPLPAARRQFVAIMLLLPFAGFGADEIVRRVAGRSASRAGPGRSRAVAAVLVTAVALGIAWGTARDGLAECAHFSDHDERRALRAGALWLREHARRPARVFAENENARWYLVVYSGLPAEAVTSFGGEGEGEPFHTEDLLRDAAAGRPSLLVVIDGSASRLAQAAAELRLRPPGAAAAPGSHRIEVRPGLAVTIHAVGR